MLLLLKIFNKLISCKEDWNILSEVPIYKKFVIHLEKLKKHANSKQPTEFSFEIRSILGKVIGLIIELIALTKYLVKSCILPAIVFSF